MTTCRVCGTSNDPLALTCSHCKGYLQAKVDALNLFETIWGIVESPGATLRRIVLARHKNYVLLLSALFGIALVYGIVWFRHAGNSIADPVLLGATGLILGPPVGLVLVGLFAVAMTRVSRMLGGKASLRNSHAVAAFATIPIVCSLVLVFPVELAVFGFDLFRSNPHPMVINPLAYTTLIGFNALAIAWSWWLVLEGAIVANSFTRLRAAGLAVMLLVLCGATLAPLVLL